MGHIDIVIYALVAGILLVRLWVIFGRRNDEDGPRPNPFAASATNAGKKDGVPFRLDPGGRLADADAADLSLAQASLAAPMSLMGGLQQVKQLDAAFDEKQFLQNARATFKAVVTAFGKGDLSDVERLLGTGVLASFRSAIASRTRSGEVLQTRIAAVKDAETTAARVEDSRAFIAVRFTSEQENVLLDAAGNIIHGAPGKTEEITDVWSFARDTKAPGSDWHVVETRV